VIGNWPTKNITYEPWQCFVWMNVIGFKNRETGFRRFRIAHIEIARGNAKALCLDTDVPTPERGLIKFGELKIGDSLYGPDGDICKIIGRNEIHIPRSFRLHFSDGTFVDCSDQHLWNTSSKEERRIGIESTKTTEEIFKTLRNGEESNHSIKVSKSVKGSREDCQLAYVLGYWLGDGNSRTGRFTAHEDQYKEIILRFKSRKLLVVEESRKGKLCVFLIPVSTSTKLFHQYIKPNATEIEFIEGRIKFGKLDANGNFYLPLNAKGKTQSGTKDSMVVVFDGRNLNNEKL